MQIGKDVNKYKILFLLDQLILALMKRHISNERHSRVTVVWDETDLNGIMDAVVRNDLHHK